MTSPNASSAQVPATAPVGMAFRLDHLQDSHAATERSKARTGNLAFQHKPESSTASHNIPTPSIISYAKKGAPVHLSRDNVDRLPIEMVMLAYEHL